MRSLLTALFASAFSLIASLASAEQIEWSDLVNKAAQNFDDPYSDLEYEQLEDLVVVAKETALLEGSDLSTVERDLSVAKTTAARERLAAAGIDADWMISQRWEVAKRREKAAVETNPDVNGVTVTLGGFAIPAPPDDDGSAVIYLVPERGICSHMPPPNPNQMIRARLTGEWTQSVMHEPIKLTGKLLARETQFVFPIVDGDVPMRASFVMEVETVQTMPVFAAKPQQTKIRSSTQKKLTSGSELQD